MSGSGAVTEDVATSKGGGEKLRRKFEFRAGGDAGNFFVRGADKEDKAEAKALGAVEGGDKYGARAGEGGCVGIIGDLRSQLGRGTLP